MTTVILILLLPAGMVVGFLHFLGWFLKPGRLAAIRELCPELDTLPTTEAFPRIQWLGHSSYRVEWRGKVFLLDPVLSSHVSVAPRLCDSPGREVLSGVEDVLITHAHMDHLDNHTLRQTGPCEVHLPRKSERFLSNSVRAQHSLHVFDPESSFTIGDLRVDVVPARHGGWRYPWQRGFFACGLIISDGETVLYYAGDSAWGDHFAEIGQRFQPDIAILPIGGYAPRWFLKSHHLNPPEAVRAADALGAKWIIPGHFGTYRVSLEPIKEPLEWFRREMLNR